MLFSLILVLELLGTGQPDVITPLRTTLDQAPTFYTRFHTTVQYSGDISARAQLGAEIDGEFMRRNRALDIRNTSVQRWPRENGGDTLIRYQTVFDTEFMQFEGKPSEASVIVSHISKDDRVTDSLGRLLLGATVLDGYIPGVGGERIDDLIAHGNDVRAVLPQEGEGNPQVPGDAIVSFTNAYGAYNVTLSLRFGYLPTRISVTRTAGNTYNGIQIGSKPQTHREVTATWPDEPILSVETTVTVDSISQVNGVYLPQSATVDEQVSYASGKHVAVHARHTRSDFSLSPDFDSLRAFHLEVPNGTEVAYLDERDIAGLRFQWQDGRVVPLVSTEVIGAIQRDLPELADVAKSKEAGRSETPPAEAPVTPRSAPRTRWHYAYLVGTSLLLCAACLLLRRFSGPK